MITGIVIGLCIGVNLGLVIAALIPRRRLTFIESAKITLFKTETDSGSGKRVKVWALPESIGLYRIAKEDQ